VSDDIKAKKLNASDYMNVIAAIVGSAVVGQFFIGIFARDFALVEPTYGVATAQPATSQIVFAVLLTYGIVGYLVMKVLNLSYIWPAISTVLITPIAVRVYGKEEVLLYFAGRWPALFFSSPVLTVLPIQVVVFGTIGSIAGYWLAASHEYQRQTEIETG
jgi:hypothetical protein